ncbi:VOC family protein [Burkholderia plantarii]|uniref:VOC family protein n=1 Tax=Burkholderia plantarii TaxID=41899 RepID=UPI0018DEACB4|nr:VOC family protein [Burkholderia plantarii]MBI0330048.1 VOC family protein [Burkholderia plantarii]
MSASALTCGIDHLGLTVRDLSETRAFFETCLGWKLLGERPEYPAAFVSDGHVTLTLWQVKDPEVVEFDRKRNIGLHHLALRVASEATLNALYERVAAWPGVRVEFAPEQLGKGTKRHTMIYEPGGIRLEFDYDTAARAG